jgi:hypothetical protein
MPPTVTLADVVEDATTVAMRLRQKTAGMKPLRVERHDEGYIDEVEEGSKVIKSEVPVASLQEFKNRLVHPIAPREPSQTFIGIDGSSRKLEAHTVLVGVYSAAVSLVGETYAAGSYPDTGIYPYIELGGKPVASIAPGLLATGQTVVGEPLIDTRKLANIVGCEGARDPRCTELYGLGYGNGYDVSTMLDENRILLENEALKYVLNQLVSHLGIDACILVDGPIYTTPGLFVSFYRLATMPKHSRPLIRLVYVLSYLVNVINRLEVVKSGLERGIRVVGIVKRIERSRLLVNAVKRLAEVEHSPLQPPTDPQLLEKLFREDTMAVYEGIALSHVYPVAIAIGPIITIIRLRELKNAITKVLGFNQLNLEAYTPITRSGERLDEIFRKLENDAFLAKRSYYLYIRDPFIGYKAVRVEIPQPITEKPVYIDSGGEPKVEKDAEVAKEVAALDGELLEQIAWLMMQPSVMPAPLPIILADQVTRSVSRSIAFTWYHALRDTVTFTYDTLVQLSAA